VLASLLADAVLLAHAAFVLFAMMGALTVLWRPWLIWIHLPWLVWAALVNLVPFTCPLTPLENALRHAAGEAGYEGGFIEHWVTAFVYPAGMTREIQLIAGVGVIVLNAALYSVVLHRRGRSRS
jgi:hypothetical protein